MTDSDALSTVFAELKAARDRLVALESAREGAPGRIAHALDDTRGYHVSVLDDDTRNEFMHRLARAAFDPGQPTSWNPVPPEKP